MQLRRALRRAAEVGLAKPTADPLLEVQGLVVAVMAERALGPRSKWGPYLSFLPDSMDHMPVYWEVGTGREGWRMWRGGFGCVPHSDMHAHARARVCDQMHTH